MLSFAAVPAGATARRGAVIAAAVLLFLVITTVPFAKVLLPPTPAFLPLFAAFAFSGELVTAYLLFTQARISGRGSLAFLGAGYLYNAAILVPHMLSFPGVFSATGLLGGHPQSAVWLWALWHGGFPLWIFAYLIVERSSSPERRRVFAGFGGITALASAAVAAAVAAGIVATVMVRHLPTLVEHGQFSPGYRSGILEAVILLDLAALAGALALRNKTVTHVWLIVALVSVCGDVILTLIGGSRFSVGWYLARCYSIAGALTVFAVFLAEVNVMYTRIYDLATIDGLTNIGNRRHFEERLGAAVRDGARNAKAVAVIIFDVDEFKKFNDLCGHLAGDEALRTVARVARLAVVRPTDTVARYGGEEFAIILPDTTVVGARIVAERVRAAIEAATVPHPGSSVSRYLTVSVGIAASTPALDEQGTALVARADGALYRAKSMGRNRVEADDVVTAEPRAAARLRAPTGSFLDAG